MSLEICWYFVGRRLVVVVIVVHGSSWACIISDFAFRARSSSLHVCFVVLPCAFVVLHLPWPFALTCVALPFSHLPCFCFCFVFLFRCVCLRFVCFCFGLCLLTFVSQWLLAFAFFLVSVCSCFRFCLCQIVFAFALVVFS